MSSVSAAVIECERRMEKSLENLKKELSRVRAGRATPSLLDGVSVEYYGTPAPINQVATITVPEARLLIVQPWEKSMLAPIEKAIQSSDLGLNPQNDGNLIRLPIPSLTEERRRELFKKCKRIGEDTKVAVRNIRRDGNEKFKKAQTDKEIAQDEQKKGTDDIQKLTDRFVKSIEDQLSLKEKELVEI